MKYLIILICFIVVISCSTNTLKTKNSLASKETQVLKPESALIFLVQKTLEPYELKLKQKLDAVTTFRNL